MSLNRKQIEALDDLPREELEVPEWGDTVWIRMLNIREREGFEKLVMDAGSFASLPHVYAKFCVLCIVDENGTRLFGDDEIEGLQERSATAIDRICKAALKLNGLTTDDVEELAKN